MKRSVAILALLLAAACSLDPVDETKNWGPERIYGAAREELDGKNYQKAIGHYEKLESRYPYGRYAQMAQIESAYATGRTAKSPRRWRPAIASSSCTPIIRTWTTPTT